MYPKFSKIKLITIVMATSIALNTLQFFYSDSPAQIKQELRSVKSWIKTKNSPQTAPEKAGRLSTREFQSGLGFEIS